MKNIFEVGELQSLQAVMDNREARDRLQKKLVVKYPTAAIAAIKLNVPGPIKSNAALDQLFTIGYQQLLDQITSAGTPIIDEINWKRATGREAFLVIEQDALALKKSALQFEDRQQLGRLFDVDIMSKALGHLSRSNFNLPVRTCLLCSRPAKECARSRRHSVAELQQKITQIYATVVTGEQ